MFANRLAILVALILVSSAWAQNNELSLTAGRTFVSTTTIVNDQFPNDFDPHIHFGNPASLEFDYARLLRIRKVFGIYAELPVAIYPRMNLHTDQNQIPKDIGALFVTPSVRMNIFAGDSVTPWVSAGGGYGRFREAPVRNFFGPNPGATGTNTGVIQFGAGLDVWFWHSWGARFEARDFYSGLPDFTVDTSNGRQHNYYVGVGVIRRF